MIQSILEIAVSLNIALCVKAGFCQIQSHLILNNLVLVDQREQGKKRRLQRKESQQQPRDTAAIYGSSRHFQMMMISKWARKRRIPVPTINTR